MFSIECVLYRRCSALLLRSTRRYVTIEASLVVHGSVDSELAILKMKLSRLFQFQENAHGVREMCCVFRERMVGLGDFNQIVIERKMLRSTIEDLVSPVTDGNASTQRFWILEFHSMSCRRF